MLCCADGAAPKVTTIGEANLLSAVYAVSQFNDLSGMCSYLDATLKVKQCKPAQSAIFQKGGVKSNEGKHSHPAEFSPFFGGFFLHLGRVIVVCNQGLDGL